MFKNKLTYLYFAVFFMICISIDFSIFIMKENEKIKNEKNQIETQNEIISKSKLVFQLDSQMISENSALFQEKTQYYNAIVSEILKKINYVITQNNLIKYHQNNYTETRFSKNLQDKYFTFNHEEGVQVQDLLYGKFYFVIEIFTTIKDELFTNYILEELELILEKEKDNIFNIINNLSEHFLSIENNLSYREYSKMLNENNFNIYVKDDFNLYVYSNKIYDPNLNNTYKRNYILPNFIPAFTILFILLFFISFIFLTIKRNFRI